MRLFKEMEILKFNCLQKLAMDKLIKLLFKNIYLKSMPSSKQEEHKHPNYDISQFLTHYF